MRTDLRRRLAWGALALALLSIGLWNLDGPAMWWDEGWTLSVARSWAETGRYARLRDGVPAAPGLEAAPTVTLPVGLSMRLLGVGLWQGRLFGVLCAVAALLLLAALAARLYDEQVAAASVATSLLLTAHPQLHPLIQGRQVLAEMPMLAYLLAGYLGLWLALAGRRLAVAPAAALFGLAWVSKGQIEPFLTISLVVPSLAALLARRWRSAAVLATTLAGAYLAAQALRQIANTALLDPQLPQETVSGLLGVVAVVLTPFNRIYALTNLLAFGLPTLLGLLWALPGAWREIWEAGGRRQKAGVALLPPASEPPASGLLRASAASDMRLALLAFAGSWLAWFAALSVGVPRYMSPPVFVGSIFLAAMLRDLTDGFDLAGSLSRVTDLLTLRRPGWSGGGALLALLLVTAALALTALGLARYYPERDFAAQRVAATLDAMPPSARVETYESELHFLLHRPYHYPPDQVHVELNRRGLLGEQATVSYDPLAADPDVLVVGVFARGNDLYAPAIASGAFRLLRRDGNYDIYERVR